MICAATTERNDVIDFHPRMEVAARCAGLGGADHPNVFPGNLATNSHLPSASIVGGRIVDFFGSLWIFLAPLSLLLIQARAVFAAVFRSFFTIMLRFLGFGARDLRGGPSGMQTIRASFLLSEMLRILFARFSAFGVYFIAFLSQVLRVVGSQVVFIFRAPSRLIGGVALAVLFRPQFRAQPRFDLSFFRAIHRETLPHGLAANNYAA